MSALPWSPDGRQIASLRKLENGKTAVILLSPLGRGPERLLLKFDSPSREDWDGSPPAWSPDSEWLLLPIREAPGAAAGLFLVSVAGGEMRRLTSGEDQFPCFSRDGRTVAFSRGSTLVGNLYSLSLSEQLKPEGEPRRLTSDNRRPHHPVWVPGGREVLFSFGTLHRLSVSGTSERSRLSYVGPGAMHPAISGSNGRLVFVRRRANTDIMRVAIPGPGEEAGRPEPFAPSTKFDQNPRYSWDGRRVAFSSYRSGSGEIWVCDSNGAGLLKLTSFGGPHCGSPRWSPGRRLCRLQFTEVWQA